jgi:hypothetical protein
MCISNNCCAGYHPGPAREMLRAVGPRHPARDLKQRTGTQQMNRNIFKRFNDLTEVSGKMRSRPWYNL